MFDPLRTAPLALRAPSVARPASPAGRLAAPAVWATALALGPLAGCGDGGSSNQNTPDIYVVERKPMRIQITEAAELKAAVENRVRSEIEGSATIIYLIPEGEVVDKGQKLVELDVSELQERRATQAITVERAMASLVNAQQNIQILAKELASLESAAVSGLEIANIDVEKFFGGKNVDGPVEVVGDDVVESGPGGVDQQEQDKVRGANRDMVEALSELVENKPAYAGLPGKAVDLLDETRLDDDMGELGQQVLEQVDQITLARQQLALAEDTYQKSKTLAADNYITANDLERDRLERERQRSSVTLAWQNLDLLISYTLRKTKIDLLLKLDNAKLELEKVRASNAARRTREEAELASVQSEYDLAKERLDNLVRQIDSAVLEAPTPGLVVYATTDSRNRETIEEGTDIRERQTILILPDVTRMQAELKIQEADIDKVRRGQPATIAVDAFPGEAFSGIVTRVSPIADSGSRWSNSSLKVYKTWVALDLDNTQGMLRPNMSARVTINVGEVPEALPVPITAVRRQDKVHYVWKVNGNGPLAVAVKVGRSTNEEVEILQGVEPGDRIYKAPPTGVMAPEFEQPVVEDGPEMPTLEAGSIGAATPRVDPEIQAKIDNVTRESYVEEIKTRLPQFAEIFASDDERAVMRAMFSNEELSAAVENDPVLSAMRAKLMEGMRARMGNRRPGGGGPGGEGGPGGGDGQGFGGGRRGGGGPGGGAPGAGGGNDGGDRGNR